MRSPIAADPRWWATGVRRTVFLAAATVVVAGASADAAAQVSPVAVSPRDSARLVEAARKRQSDFELYRQSRIPVHRPREEATCDERIGRICIWFGGEDERDFPEERPEVAMARAELVGVLNGAARQIRDPWVVGQQVHYLAESGNLLGAQRAAEACELNRDRWWCDALRGYVLHLQGRWSEAEAAFRAATSALEDDDDRERWLEPRYVIPRGDVGDYPWLDDDDRVSGTWETFWRLSDPLFLVEGNDRLTDHWARWVEARNQSDAENPQGIFWEEDVEETLIRYGRIMGYSRTGQQPERNSRRGFALSLQDTRSVLGHHDPFSRGYLFPLDYLESPSDVPPESWITAPREARTWYAPPYAPETRGLETQVGRFRRGSEMLVIGAYRPEPVDSDRLLPVEGGGSGGEATDALQAGLFLIPVGDRPEDDDEPLPMPGDVVSVRSDEGEGVLTLRAPPGRYVASLEVFDQAERRAWRARQGIRQDSLAYGLVALSDLLILSEGAPRPESLEEAVPHVRRGVRLRPGERFEVVWEVYGVRVQQPAQVTLGFTRGRPGFLERVGEFLGVLEPDTPVEISFEDPGSDVVQTQFRSMRLELPELEPGEYTLHLRVELPGRTPVVASRPVVVEG